MKRVISSELPAGYLSTNKFNCPSIKTDDQRNVLEAIELAIAQKYDLFQKFCDRQFILTSCSAWTGTVMIDENNGYYIRLTATRAEFVAYVLGDSVIRKPRNNGPAIAYYDVEGESGQLYHMSRRKLTPYGKKLEET